MKVKGLNQEVDFLLDIAAINKKYAARAGDPRRYFTGTFVVDSGISKPALERKVYESCGRFIEAFYKKRWDCIGQCTVFGPYTYRDIDTGLVVLGKTEYRIRAPFQMADTPKSVRTEIPSGLIRRDAEQALTVKEAKAAVRGII
jgi:hypothetical protein